MNRRVGHYTLILSAALCLALGAGLPHAQTTGSICDVSETAWAYFKNYLAWSETWWSRSYAEEAGSMPVECAREHDRIFFYLPSDRFMVGYYPEDKSGQAVGSTCPLGSEPWTQCVPPVRSGEASIPEMLLGRTPPSEPLAISGICRTQLRRSDLPVWRPSRDSPNKRTLLSKIDAVVHEAAGYWGSLNKAAVNDFNVLDPWVYAVADVKENSVRQQRVLVSVAISLAGGGSASVSRTEELGPQNSDFIRKVLKNSIRLP